MYRYANVLFPFQQVTNSTTQLDQIILQNKQQTKEKTDVATTQQQGQKQLSQQPTTVQQQLSITQGAVEQQMLFSSAQSMSHITEQRQQISQPQTATAQATVQQMHIPGPKIIPPCQARLHAEPQVKSEDGKQLLTGYEQNLGLSQGTLDGQEQRSHRASNSIDSSTSALAILADSSLEYNHSASRLLHNSISTSTITRTTTVTTSPTINVPNVTCASSTKHVQPSVSFPSELASFPEAVSSATRFTVPPISNIMSSLKSAATTAGGARGPPQTAVSSTSMILAAAETTTSFPHASSENMLSATEGSSASANSVPPQVLGIQQIAAQIIQEAKKQERKATELVTTT